VRRWVLLAVVVLLLVWWLAQQCNGWTTSGSGPTSGRSLPPGPTLVPDSTLPAAVPAEGLAARARDSATAARSVHLTGTAELPGTGTVTVALTLTTRDATGTVTVGGRQYEVIRVGSQIWTRPATGGAWTSGDEVQTDAGPASLFGVTDRARWLAVLVPSPEGATAAPATEQVDGATVRRVLLRDGSLMYVLADPQRPYPVRLDGTPTHPARLRLSGWDRPVTISPPPGR
jgi:hypothetical protein